MQITNRTPSVNRFGRKPGRGLRPWLLLPKLICVGLYLGSLAGVLVLILPGGFSALPADDAQRIWTIENISNLVVYLTIPALVGALLLGAGLFGQHPRVFIRMRWVRVKLFLLAVLIPSAHLASSSRLARLREEYHLGIADSSAAKQFAWLMALALAGSILIVVLGRLKPRLGQDWGAAYPKATGRKPEEAG